MCTKQFKTITKYTVPNDVYKSMYVESPSSFTSETDVKNNQQNELGMIYLNPVNTLTMTSAITQLEPSP